jgi:N-acetylglutamate synthase-like GNAT family acetyltransferase
MGEEIIYRLATDTDIDAINDFYTEFNKKSRSREQFIWEYNSAPAGKTIYVIAELNSKIIGTQCAIPYYLITKNNEKILTAKSEDTLVSPYHRGKSVFDNMYKLLLEQCKNAGIRFIWGFTYADKPFRKLGFEIPFRSTMGMLCTQPSEAAQYFYSITAKKNTLSFLKIHLLCWFSALRHRLLLLRGGKALPIDSADIDLNTKDFNYLTQQGTYGLMLDKDFLDYRTRRNPYNSNYNTISYSKSGQLLISVKYVVTKQNIGFILHLYMSPELNRKEGPAFLRQLIKGTKLGKCSVIRYWGFEHTTQNREEVKLLKESNFTFLSRGICFVGLNLMEKNKVDFHNFVLSRMASQGTD